MIYQKGSNLFNVAIYIRLSREDGDKEESDSVGNQRKLLTEYVNKHDDFILYDVYIDDGFTGTNFNRPDFHRMVADIEDNKVNCVVVKDLSRFGRDYIDTGRYLERIFPELNVRFISVTDNIDSMKQAYDMLLPIKNIFNEQYARDISNKIQATVKSKQKAGEFIGAFTSYGYKKSPANKNKLVIDEYASEVVKRVFTMYAQGIGKQSIAKILNAEGILCPSEYKKLNGENYKNCNRLEKTSYWTYSTIKVMLQNEIYIGNMVQGKQERISYKVKQRLDKPESEWVKVENTHPAIIRQSDFDVVQKLLQYDGRASKTSDSANFFSGFVFCGDCKTPMIRRVNQYKGKKKAFYICQTKNKGGDCTRHSIPEEVLKRIVLKEIQAYTALFIDYQMIMEELCEMQVSYDQVIGYDTQISKLQEEYNRYYSLKASLGDDLKEGLISKAEFDDFRESYGRKCEELEQMIENQKKLVKQMFEGGVSATVQLEDWKKSLEIKELDRTLLALTVDKIYIYENKQIKIHIRYQDMIEKMKVIRRFYAEHRTECRKEVG